MYPIGESRRPRPTYVELGAPFEEDGLLVFADDEVEAMTAASESVDREKA